VYQWFAELQLFQGKDQQGKSEKTLRAYNYRLGFFLDFTVQNDLRYLDQIDRKQLLRYVKFLRSMRAISRTARFTTSSKP
jgi:site-specific recombinase XerD